MILPRFLRRWAAWVMTLFSNDIGGMLYDYKNGRWEGICTWTTREEDAAANIIITMRMNQRDEIYIACQKCEGFGRGYFIVFDSRGGEYRRDFWMGIYDPDEALIDISKRCRKIADKMGYRRLE